MSIEKQIQSDIKDAMRAKDKIRLNVLRYLKKLFIDNDVSTKPIAEMDIVISHAKKTKDSLSMYPDGSEQQATIKAEIKILEEFLPKQLAEDDVKNIIAEIVSNLEKPNMGAIMKELSPKIKGQFDGKKASQMVQEALK